MEVFPSSALSKPHSNNALPIPNPCQRGSTQRTWRYQCFLPSQAPPGPNVPSCCDRYIYFIGSGNPDAMAGRNRNRCSGYITSDQSHSYRERGRNRLGEDQHPHPTVISFSLPASSLVRIDAIMYILCPTSFRRSLRSSGEPHCDSNSDVVNPTWFGKRGGSHLSFSKASSSNRARVGTSSCLASETWIDGRASDRFIGLGRGISTKDSMVLWLVARVGQIIGYHQIWALISLAQAPFSKIHESARQIWSSAFGTELR